MKKSRFIKQFNLQHFADTGVSIKTLLKDLWTDDIAKALEGKEFVDKSEINGNYIPKARFDEVNNAKKDLDKEVKKYQGEIEKLSTNNTDIEAVKEQLLAKTEEFKQYQLDIETKEVNQNKTSALIKHLESLNALNPALLVKEYNLDDVSFDDNGGLVGVKSTTERIQADYKQQFGEVNINTPDVHNNGGGSVTKEQLSKFTYNERTEFKKNNPNDYKALTE